MQSEHGFVWRAILDTIDVDLSGKRVLDAGCNQGGFLRLLADRAGIAEGFGYDPAAGAIEDARRLAGERPLRFETGDAPPAGWRDFDVAFSHEVIYLIHDLSAHARAVHESLAPGGVYYAVIGVHAGSPMMAAWHRQNPDAFDLPELRDIDDVMATFHAEGFDAAAARLAIRFVPAFEEGHHRDAPIVDWLDYYHEQKLMLRFARPAE
jgi:SAM-dependent methyltransferase